MKFPVLFAMFFFTELVPWLRTRGRSKIFCPDQRTDHSICEYKVTTRLMYRSMTQESLDEVFKRTGQALSPIVRVEMAAAKTSVMFQPRKNKGAGLAMSSAPFVDRVTILSL